jgi:hypothetical protein
MLYRPDSHQTKASSVRTTWVPFWTFLCVEKLQTAPACILPEDSARLDDPLCLWIPVRTRLSIRQVSQFKSRRPDASHHGPEARVSNMEIACIRSTVRTTILLVQMRKAFIWKLLAANVQPSRRQGNTVQTRLSKMKDFQRNFQNFGRTFVCPNGL